MSLYETKATAHPAGYRDVAVTDLKLPQVGVQLIDVREPAEFTGELGHVPGAKLVPLAAVAAQAIAWDKQAEYLLICRSGGRSGMAAQTLLRMGFPKVMNLVGGMLAWNQAGLVVEK